MIKPFWLPLIRTIFIDNFGKCVKHIKNRVKYY